jgi:hypothetical protein
MIDEPCLRPVQVLVRDSQRPAGGDAGVFCPARWRWWPRRKTRANAPAPAPDYAAGSRPPGNLTAQWATRSLVAPVSTPPDRDDGAPGWGRLCSASSSVDHWPCSRLPWLSTTGIARGGEVGGATPGGRGGRGGDGCGGVGRRRDAAHPRVLVAVWRFLRRRCGSFIGNDGQQTNNNQNLTKGGFRQGGLNFAPLPGIGGRGWQDLIWCRKEGPGMQLSSSC